MSSGLIACTVDEQDYRSAVDAIKAGTGLEEADILDVRGNHDTFNVKTRSGFARLKVQVSKIVGMSIVDRKLLLQQHGFEGFLLATLEASPLTKCQTRRKQLMMYCGTSGRPSGE